MKLDEIVKEYLESLKYSIKLKTYLFYLQFVESYISKFVGDIKTQNLNDFIIEFKTNYSYSTTKMAKSLINRGLKYAMKNGLIADNASVTIQLKNFQLRKVEALEKGEQQKLENYILDNNKKYYYGILISLYTGIRLGEVIA